MQVEFFDYDKGIYCTFCGEFVTQGIVMKGRRNKYMCLDCSLAVAGFIKSGDICFNSNCPYKIGGRTDG